MCGVSEKYLRVLTFVLPLGFRKNMPKNNTRHTRITNFRRQQKRIAVINDYNNGGVLVLVVVPPQSVTVVFCQFTGEGVFADNRTNWLLYMIRVLSTA